MSTNIFQQVPYLRTSRNFPLEAQPLSVEISKSYLDIATFVNDRTIGIFPSLIPAITGNRWYQGGESTIQQTLRQVYPITGAGSYAHNVPTYSFGGFVQIYGTFTDNADPLVGKWYPLPYVDVVAATNQINLTITPSSTTTSGNIVVTAGGGAPTIVSGWIVLEWLSNS
jgi:hypothetical protein